MTRPAISSMVRIHGFPPIERADARVLVLGTMPSEASLRARQYYGHPRNAFWSIVGDVLGFDWRAGYEQRSLALRQNRIALWDVLASCTRAGSLDSAISSASMEPNDFAAFFARHRQVRRVCFNGAMAQSLYRRRVLPLLALDRELDYVRLPSTSPANAGMPYAAKLEAWRAIGP